MQKFKFIEMKYGLAGFAITIKLYQYIYSLGYYADWDEYVYFFADEIKAIGIVEEVVESAWKGKYSIEACMNVWHLKLSWDTERYRNSQAAQGRGDKPDYLLIDGDFGINEDTTTASSKRNDGKNKPKENSKAFDEDSLEYSLANKLKAPYC